MAIDEAALQRLLDKEAIREASLRYTRGVDRHDADIMAAAYHSDATDDHGAYIGDPAGFIRYANDVHARHWVTHQHYVTNQTIELDGDVAHVETYFLATLRRSTGTVDMVGGRYVDRFERRQGRWAVADRACLVEWNGELPPAAVAVDPELFLRGAWDRSDLSYQRPLLLNRPPRDGTF
jgi:ketosteroid isomerase-like protein